MISKSYLNVYTFTNIIINEDLFIAFDWEDCHCQLPMYCNWNEVSFLIIVFSKYASAQFLLDLRIVQIETTSEFPIVLS